MTITSAPGEVATVPEGMVHILCRYDVFSSQFSERSNCVNGLFYVYAFIVYIIALLLRFHCDNLSVKVQ